MKLDKNKVIAILLEEAKKDPQILMKVVELLPTLIAVYERIMAEAKKESPKAPSSPSPVEAPPPGAEAPKSWLENVFHSWYQDGPDTSDMTTTEEVASIVEGEAAVPPGAQLWLMCDAPDALWCFSVDQSRTITFRQEGEEKFWTGPMHEFFNGARYKQQPDGTKDARHIILSLRNLDGRHTLHFWVSDGGINSPVTSIPLAGKKL